MPNPTVTAAHIVARPEAIHRVCRVLRADCKECPLSEEMDGETWIRGCVHMASEVINAVETGNPWRKTEAKAPWAAFPGRPEQPDGLSMHAEDGDRIVQLAYANPADAEAAMDWLEHMLGEPLP